MCRRRRQHQLDTITTTVITTTTVAAVQPATVATTATTLPRHFGHKWALNAREIRQDRPRRRRRKPIFELSFSCHTRAVFQKRPHALFFTTFMAPSPLTLPTTSDTSPSSDGVNVNTAFGPIKLCFINDRIYGALTTGAMICYTCQVIWTFSSDSSDWLAPSSVVALLRCLCGLGRCEVRHSSCLIGQC